eukprot:Selendium_serpulae@DN1342_c0_g1_i1.p1
MRRILMRNAVKGFASVPTLRSSVASHQRLWFSSATLNHASTRIAISHNQQHAALGRLIFQRRSTASVSASQRSPTRPHVHVQATACARTCKNNERCTDYVEPYTNYGYQIDSLWSSYAPRRHHHLKSGETHHVNSTAHLSVAERITATSTTAQLLSNGAQQCRYLSNQPPSGAGARPLDDGKMSEPSEPLSSPTKALPKIHTSTSSPSPASVAEPHSQSKQEAVQKKRKKGVAVWLRSVWIGTKKMFRDFILGSKLFWVNLQISSSSSPPSSSSSSSSDETDGPLYPRR